MENDQFDDLYRRPGFLLRRAHQIAEGIFVEECAAYQLRPPQHSALIVIDRCSGIDQAALARAIGVDRATMGSVIEGMLARALVRRENSALDKRRKTLVLTPKGRALMKRSAPAIQRTSERLLGSLPANRRDLFVKLLVEFTQNLNEASRSPVVSPSADET